MDVDSDAVEEGRSSRGLVGGLAPLNDEVFQAPPGKKGQFTDTILVGSQSMGGGEADVGSVDSGSDVGCQNATSIASGGRPFSASASSLEDEELNTRRRRRNPTLPSNPGQRPEQREIEPQQDQKSTRSRSESFNSDSRNLSVPSSSRPLDVTGRRDFFAASKEFRFDEGALEEDFETEEGRGVEQVDPTQTSPEPSSPQEYAFVITVGVLLTFNMGFINGACLSGFIRGTEQGVAGYTNPYSQSALGLAKGDHDESLFQTCMIACFVGGACLSGALTPNAQPYRIEPTYGPSFLASALCLGVATILAATKQGNPNFVFYLAGAASGIQNGISSSYTAKLIRSTGMTGTSTDIGLYLGQWMRGNKQNTPKLIVLLILATAFWMGGLISFYIAEQFTSLTLLLSTGLFLIIGLSLMIFLVKKLKISFRAAMFGTWQWQVAVEKIQDAFEELLDMSGSHLNGMSDRELEEIFDRIDVDNSGTIDSEELYILLRSTGVKITRAESDAMLRFADKDGDGELSKEEWKNAIHKALAPRKSVVQNTMQSMRKLNSSAASLMSSTRDLMGMGKGQKKSNRSVGSNHQKSNSSFSNSSLRKYSQYMDGVDESSESSSESLNKAEERGDSVTSAKENGSQEMAGGTNPMEISHHSDASANFYSAEIYQMAESEHNKDTNEGPMH